jgi:hypothetical protein
MSELARALPEVRLIAHPVLPPSFKGRTWWLDQKAARVLVAEYLKLLPSAARLAMSRLIRPLSGQPSQGGSSASASAS